MDYPFKAWDWDGGEYVTLKTNDVVEAIHLAWNYEFDVFERESGNLIFSGNEDNEGNSEMLEPSESELFQFRRMWQDGEDIGVMAKEFKTNRRSIALAVMDQAEQGRIEQRRFGLHGN